MGNIYIKTSDEPYKKLHCHATLTVWDVVSFWELNFNDLSV